MTKLNWVSLVSAVLVVVGNVLAVLIGWETWQVASAPVLLGLGVLGIHPVLD